MAAALWPSSGGHVCCHDSHQPCSRSCKCSDSCPEHRTAVPRAHQRPALLVAVAVETGGAEGAAPVPKVKVLAVDAGQPDLVAVHDGLLGCRAAGPGGAGGDEPGAAAAERAGTHCLHGPGKSARLHGLCGARMSQLLLPAHSALAESYILLWCMPSRPIHIEGQQRNMQVTNIAEAWAACRPCVALCMSDDVHGLVVNLTL